MHTENNTAPPGVQPSQSWSDAEPERGFTWLSVVVREINLPFQCLPLLQKGLAVELAEMLQAIFPSGKVRIEQFADVAENADEVRRTAMHHKDVIIAVRGEPSPGSAYIARIEELAERLAPRSAIPAKRGAGREVQQ